MSGYEVEHNIPAEQNEVPQRSRRPDLSTFFSTLELVDTSGEHTQRINTHALPQPGDVAAAFRTLANAFLVMRGEPIPAEGRADDVLATLVESLMRSAEDPPREVQGVPDTFLDELDRVPKKALRPNESCPICSNPFLDDPYPLVVRLPCDPKHRFDLECIRPWLKLNSTCPLDRKELLKKQQPKVPVHDDDDGEWNDFYA